MVFNRSCLKADVSIFFKRIRKKKNQKNSHAYRFVYLSKTSLGVYVYVYQTSVLFEHSLYVSQGIDFFFSDFSTVYETRNVTHYVTLET